MMYISIITYYNKQNKRRHFISSFINPSIDITEEYIINSLPTIQRNEIKLLENIEIIK